jgi:hypothetical protein
LIKRTLRAVAQQSVAIRFLTLEIVLGGGKWARRSKSQVLCAQEPIRIAAAICSGFMDCKSDTIWNKAKVQNGF